MSAYLDLGDVVAGHPKATEELDQLYADCEQLLKALEGVMPFLTGNYWPGVESDVAVDRAIDVIRKARAGH